MWLWYRAPSYFNKLLICLFVIANLQICPWPSSILIPLFLISELPFWNIQCIGKSPKHRLTDVRCYLKVPEGSIHNHTNGFVCGVAWHTDWNIPSTNKRNFLNVWSSCIVYPKTHTDWLSLNPQSPSAPSTLQSSSVNLYEHCLKEANGF